MGTILRTGFGRPTFRRPTRTEITKDDINDVPELQPIRNERVEQIVKSRRFL